MHAITSTGTNWSSQYCWRYRCWIYTMAEPMQLQSALCYGGNGSTVKPDDLSRNQLYDLDNICYFDHWELIVLHTLCCHTCRLHTRRIYYTKCSRRVLTSKPASTSLLLSYFLVWAVNLIYMVLWHCPVWSKLLLHQDVTHDPTFWRILGSSWSFTIGMLISS
jgi:hypothetical protein